MALLLKISHQLLALFINAILLLIHVDYVHPQRIVDKIYSNLASDHYCSRRLNATHQFGCTSNLGGNIGTLWIVEDTSDLDHILKNGPTPPYAAVVKSEHFTKANILNFKQHADRIAGVVFIVEEETNSAQLFSPDDVCPNRYSGLYANDTEYVECKKNTWQELSPVSGLLFEDIPFPIFMINQKNSINQIYDCFNKNNMVKTENSESKKVQANYPLCGIHLDSFMQAAVNSFECMESFTLADEVIQSQNPSSCKYVEANNVFGYFKNETGPGTRISDNRIRPGYVEEKSILLLVAKLSSISMFNNISPGADSTITGIVALLAIAEALKQVRDNTKQNKFSNSNKNIAFALLDSEPFDYTGSSQMAMEMQKGVFPFRTLGYNIKSAEKVLLNINLTAIETIIDLNQLASHDKNGDIFVHFNPNADEGQADKIFRHLQDAGKNEINFKRATGLPLPPSPIQSFLKYSMPSNKLVGAVLGNYDKKYTNKYYHSIFDNLKNINRTFNNELAEHLTKVSGAIAKAVFQLSYPESGDVPVNVHKSRIEELLHCYLISADCSLFTEAWKAGHKLPSGPVQTYRDPTKKSDDMNAEVTRSILSYFLSETTPYNQTSCIEAEMASNAYSYSYVNGNSTTNQGYCIVSQVFTLYNSRPIQQNSLWTVSLNSINYPVRLFLIPNPCEEWFILLLGFIVTGVSFYLVLLIKEATKNNQPLGTST